MQRSKSTGEGGPAARLGPRMCIRKGHARYDTVVSDKMYRKAIRPLPMKKINKYGLSRDIPSEVKRAVRQNSGFGCVLCGLSLYTYDHIDPPWAEAQAHMSDKICLLCPNHHERKNKGLLSMQEIKAAYQAPFAKTVGYSHDPEFRTCQRPLELRLGNLVFNDPREVLRIGGELLLAVEDLGDGHIALSGRFSIELADSF